MTISKRNSRKIIVNNEEYSWAISPCSGYVILIVETKNNQGRKIEVTIKTDINDYWVNIPNIEELNLKILKPREVESIIKQALESGWDPKVKGKAMTYSLIENQIVKS